MVVFTVCLLSVGSGISDQPEKRVMNIIAVMDLKCGKGMDKAFSAPLTDVVIEELVKIGKYTVVNRADRDKILREQEFQCTAYTDEGCSVEIGRILGAGKMVVGSIAKIGNTYQISLQLINVETANIEVAASERCKKCEVDDLFEVAGKATRKLMGQAPLPTSPSSQPQPTGVKGGEMVRVPEGEFTMGSDSGDSDEKPAHRVYLDEFHIDKYEVTNEQYNQCISAGPCSPNKKYNGFTDPRQPVVGVDWNQASTYCSWAGKRLPTEAEWEKAARGKDGRTYPWGEGIDCTKANYYKCGHKKTKPVGSYPSGASPYGAMDMAGNVWEWTADWYDKKYYRNSPNRNPKGPSSGTYRVVRGGGWILNPRVVRPSDRLWSAPSNRIDYYGFRCAR